MSPDSSESSRPSDETYDREDLEGNVTIAPPSWLSEERRDEWLWVANYLLELEGLAFSSTTISKPSPS